jgi:hypothetical protein
VNVSAVAAGILIGVGVIAVAAAARGIWMSARVFGDLRRFVIPHFVPPTAEEIRLGATDNTLPARVERQESRLATHLVVEEIEVGQVKDELVAINRKLSIVGGEGA